MATIYEVVGKNSGKDVSVTITDSQGNQFNAAQIGILTHFKVTSNYKKAETESLINGGATYVESLPTTVECEMKFTRKDSGLEDMESLYRTQSFNGTQLSYTVQYQTQNRDGSINTRQLVKIKPESFDLGEYKPGEDVTQSVKFVGSTVNNTGASSGLF